MESGAMAAATGNADPAKGGIPPIDGRLPARIETATFALG
jgi:hypothetical protein